MDFKFNFELLRIRSRQLRNSISFNSMLYFTLFGLFLFIIVLHLRGSSPHYSSLTFFKNLFGAICCCCGRLRKRSSSSTRLANGYDPEPLFGAHSSIAARLELEKLFGGSAKGGKGRGKKNQGFRRLPTNESEVVEDVEDDDDDDEGSDILEDFNPNASLTKNRLVWKSVFIFCTEIVKNFVPTIQTTLAKLKEKLSFFIINLIYLFFASSSSPPRFSSTLYKNMLCDHICFPTVLCTSAISLICVLFVLLFFAFSITYFFSTAPEDAALGPFRFLAVRKRRTKGWLRKLG